MDNNYSPAIDLSAFIDPLAGSVLSAPEAHTICIGEHQLPHGISYVSAPCGSGKSYGLANYIAEQLSYSTLENPKRFLYVAPTIDLIREFETVLNSQSVHDVMVFHSENSQGSVASRLMAHFRDSDRTAMGSVTLTTHESFLNLPYFHNRRNWQIFIDEVPQIDQFFDLKVPTNAIHLKANLQSLPYTEQLAIISKKTGANLDEFLATKDNGFSDSFIDFLYNVNSSNYTVYG